MSIWVPKQPHLSISGATAHPAPPQLAVGVLELVHKAATVTQRGGQHALPQTAPQLGKQLNVMCGVYGQSNVLLLQRRTSLSTCNKGQAPGRVMVMGPWGGRGEGGGSTSMTCTAAVRTPGLWA